MIESALEGTRVLDLTHYVAGPYCTKLLADYGADVIKIERPAGGDGARRLGPFPGDVPDPEKSGLFLHLNTNKRSMVLDLKRSDGQALLKELAARADILVENFRPGVMADLRLSYDVLSAINPLLVMVSITDFGQTGPYRSYKGSEMVTYALGGAMHTAGLAGREPLKLGGSVVSYLAGTHGAAAAGVALVGADLRGYGDWVDISIMETQAASPDRRSNMLLAYQFTGLVMRQGMISPPPVRPCKDGYMNMQVGLPWLDRLGNLYGMPELKDDPRFSDPVEAAKPENADLFESISMNWLGERTMLEAWREAQAAHVLSGPIYTFEHVLADPNFRERGYWEDIEHPAAGKLRYPGLPFTTFQGPRPDRRPAPLLGQHTDEVLRELGHGRKEVARWRRQGVVA